MATPQAKALSNGTPQASRFTKMAHGIKQDLEAERQARNKPTPDSVQRKRTVNFDLSRQVSLQIIVWSAHS
jgi:hypothetical protein